MSLCIAAACLDEHQNPRIVVCFDSMVSTDSARSESELKLEDLPFGFVCMFAGTVTEAREVLAIYKSRLSALDEFPSGDNALEELRAPLRIKKRRMIESFVQARLGLPYDEFLTRQDQIDVGVRAEMFSRIQDMNVNVELIIAGYSEGQPRIFKIAWDDVGEHTTFACIGAGAPAAEHALYRREQRTDTGLVETLYNIYEAKKFGGLAPSVGDQTYMAVVDAMTYEGKVLMGVSRRGLWALQELYEMYGPKPLKGHALGVNEREFLVQYLRIQDKE